jgi:hypothetical protein
MTDSANLFLAILFIGCIGFMYAACYDTIHTTIPATFPLAVTEDAETWNFFLWIYDISCVIISIGTGINVILSGRIVKQVIALSIYFVCMLTTLFLWAANYNILLHLIPDAISGLPKVDSIPTITQNNYDTGFTVLMLAFLLLMLLVGGAKGRITSGSGAKQPKQPKQKMKIIKEVQYKNKPKYEYKREVYAYPNKKGEVVEKFGTTKTQLP